jgi:hypothetical protein
LITREDLDILRVFREVRIHHAIAVPSWLLPALLALAVIAFGSLKFVFRRRRNAALKDTAQLLGLSFEGEDWAHGTRAPQLETPLFGRKNGEIRNIMTGNREGLPASFFDYSFGQGRSYTEQTIAAFSQDVWLPQFELGPQGILSGIVNAILHKDILFESQPDFSKRFRLASVDPENTRKVFTPGLLSFLESFGGNSKLRLEGFGQTLVIYRSGKTVGLEQFPSFVDETTRIAKTFFSLSGLKESGHRPGVIGLIPDKS